MDRRRFVLLSTIGGLSLSLPFSCSQATMDEQDPQLLQAKSLAAIWNPDEIKKIGDLYRAQFPGEKSEGVLIKKLLAQLPSDPSDIENDLQRLTIKDFQDQATVLLNGWLLSRTEARQCALFSLTQ